VINRGRANSHCALAFGDAERGKRTLGLRFIADDVRFLGGLGIYQLILCAAKYSGLKYPRLMGLGAPMFRSSFFGLHRGYGDFVRVKYFSVLCVAHIRRLKLL